MDSGISAKEPLVPIGISDHQLKRPGVACCWTTKDIIGPFPQQHIRLPRLERQGVNQGGSCDLKVIRILESTALDIPLLEQSTNHLLITSQNLDIDIMMLTRLHQRHRSSVDPPATTQGIF